MSTERSRRPLRLGILDAVPPEFYIATEKTDPEKFIDMFDSIAAPFSFATYQSTEGHFPAALEECDAYLITGSPCSVYDTYTWIPEMEAFIRETYAAEKPLVGICFGHQLIAQTLGGSVRLAERGWLLGLHAIELHSSKGWMRDQALSHPLYFINQDQVVELPPDVELLAGSDACPNAMYSVDKRLLSLQAHPEQPHASMRAFTQLLVDKYHIDPPFAATALQSMANGEPDATLFAEWIAAFLLSACDRALE